MIAADGRGGESARPLAGWRVLVTRADHQAEQLSRCLAAAGAEAVVLPVIRILPSPEPERLDAALRALANFDWVVFTSVNAVQAVAERLEALGLPFTALGRCRLAAIGPATAAALRERGLAVDVVPEEYVAEGVLRALAARDTWPGRRVLLP
ncbi:MAG TPA: uroporphyrinogen-III synthase, partial [Limnochordales bacterium]